MRRSVVAIVLLAAIAVAGAVFYAARGSDTADPGRTTVAAPIDKVDVQIGGSTPTQVTVKISAGLPSGCAKADSHSLKRSGDTFTVTVLNSMPLGNPICTAIYGTYEVSVDLGNDLRAGVTYTVQVNDKTTTFKI